MRLYSGKRIKESFRRGAQGAGKLRDSRGMTMAELLIVVAIILVLAAVVFIAIIQHQRSLAQLERDTIAKEIFIAAQNHLTAAEGEGYPGLSDLKDIKDDDDKVVSQNGNHGTFQGITGKVAKDDGNDYYMVVNRGLPDKGGTGSDGSLGGMFGLMLPFGSIDENVRGGGSYIIRYDRAKAQIEDVFYCSAGDSRFGHDLSAGEYAVVCALAVDDADAKKSRRSYGDDKAVLGWYGGQQAQNLARMELQRPVIKVHNNERLTVSVDDVNADAGIKNGGVTIQPDMILLVTGLSSGAQYYFKLERKSADNIKYSSKTNTTTGSLITEAGYVVTLDDITTAGMNFAKLFPTGTVAAGMTSAGIISTAGTSTAGGSNSKLFIPGENLKIQAIAYSNKALAAIQYSAEKTTNSLFWDAEKTGASEVINTAYINNMRHLENLDQAVSNRNANGNAFKVDIASAVQTDNLIWVDNDGETRDFVSTIKDQKNDEGAPAIYKYNSTTAAASGGSYLPVDLTGFSYDGRGHSIKSVTAGANSAGHAGLFGLLTKCSVKNLELIDFSIHGGSGAAGALAGSITAADSVQTSVENVVAHNSSADAKSGESRTVTGGDAGGLVGSMSGSTISSSGAAITVSGTNAGGLVGGASGGNIRRSFSGGHTDQGEYYTHNNGKRDKAIYNVTGSTAAGGLVGSSTASISNSYSTCSVSGSADSSKAGGFVGSASGSIKGSYCTGLVKTHEMTETTNKNEGKVGAFAGTLASGTTTEKCQYFEIMNEVNLKKGDKTTLDHYLYAVGDREDSHKNAITAIDTDAAAYEAFAGARGTWDPANAYDNATRKYYRGKFNLRTVHQLPASDENLWPYEVPKKTSQKEKEEQAEQPQQVDPVTGQPVEDDTTTVTSTIPVFVSAHYGDWPAPEIFTINK